MASTHQFELRRRSIGDRSADRPSLVRSGLWLIVAAGLLAAVPWTMVEAARAADGNEPAALKERGVSVLSAKPARPAKADDTVPKDDTAQKDDAVQKPVRELVYILRYHRVTARR